MAQEVNGIYATTIGLAVKLAFQIGGERYLEREKALNWILDKMMFGNDHILPYNRFTVDLYDMLGDDERIVFKVMDDSIVGQ